MLLCCNSLVQWKRFLSAERKSLTAAEMESEILVILSNWHLRSQLASFLQLALPGFTEHPLQMSSKVRTHADKQVEIQSWPTDPNISDSFLLKNTTYQVITKAKTLMVCVNLTTTFKIHFLTSLPSFFHTDIYVTAVYSLHLYVILQRCHVTPWTMPQINLSIFSNWMSSVNRWEFYFFPKLPVKTPTASRK